MESKEKMAVDCALLGLALENRHYKSSIPEHGTKDLV